MLEGSLLKSNYLGKDGFIWWLGQIAPAKVWRNDKSRLDNGPSKKPAEGEDATGGSWAYRCKVRIIGYHPFDRSVLPDDDLPWAHVMASNESGSFQGGVGQSHRLVGGETAFGFFLDGDDGQQPVVVGVLHRNESVKNFPEEKIKDQLRPFTGHSGTLKQQATQIRRQEKGVQGAPTTSSSPIPNVTKVTEILPKNTPTSRDATKPGADQAVRQDLATQQFGDEGSITITRENGCTDNLIGKISQELNNFIQFISRIQDFIGTYIDPLLNTFVDIVQEIKGFARRIAGIVKFIINNMRGAIIKLITDLFRDYIAKVLPQTQHPPVAEATKNIVDIIYCLFEKIIFMLIDFIVNLLSNMIGKAINAPMCAVEEWTAGILGKLMEFIDDLLGPVMSGLDWLLGGLGQITGVLSQVSSIAQQILNFIGCDQLKCEASTTWSSKTGAEKKQRDAWNKTLKKLNFMKGVNNSMDEAFGAISMYGNTGISPFRDCAKRTANPTSQQDQTPLPAGVISSKCIPPEVTVFGDGVLGQIRVIVNDDGQVVTAEVLNPGRGYSRPPRLNVIDNTNHGESARLEATIQDGSIHRVYVLSPGQGYCPGNYSSSTLVPVYVVTADKYSIFEGDKVTLTVQTQNVPDGTTVDYYLTGDISPTDIDVPIEGTLKIQDGKANLVITARQDSEIENVETMFIDLFDVEGDYVARTKILISNRLSPVISPEPEFPIESPPGTIFPLDPEGGTIGIGTDTNINPIIIPGGVGTGVTVGIGTNVVGIITDVVSQNPGFGYTSGDTVTFGDQCTYNVIVTETGSIIGVQSGTSCKYQYTSNPGEGVINTTTGQAASLYPVLQYIPQFKKITVVNQFGVISVIDCI